MPFQHQPQADKEESHRDQNPTGPDFQAQLNRLEAKFEDSRRVFEESIQAKRVDQLETKLEDSRRGFEDSMSALKLERDEARSASMSEHDHEGLFRTTGWHAFQTQLGEFRIPREPKLKQ